MVRSPLSEAKYYNAIEGDQAEVTLFVEDGPKESGDILMHRESGRVDNEPAKSGAVLPLIPHIKIQSRYLNRGPMNGRMNGILQEQNTESIPRL